MIVKSETMTQEELVDLAKKYDSIYFHNALNKAARWALGSSLELLDGIMTDKVQNGFAIIRPPGHHAMHDEPNGYCYFNNAAVTAKVAIEKYSAKRVLIVDWDVHHGQATQRMFYDNPKCVSCSAFEPFFPSRQVFIYSKRPVLFHAPIRPWQVLATPSRIRF